MRQLLTYLRNRFANPGRRGVCFVAHAAWAPDLLLARRAVVQSSRPAAPPHQAVAVINGRGYLAWWLAFRQRVHHGPHGAALH